jgi:hypothetical protein
MTILILDWCILLRYIVRNKEKHLCTQLYLRDLYLGTYYRYYMFRPIWAIFRYHVYNLYIGILTRI